MSAAERYVCIHGHFYQPPRENPWLEAIELQDSARPYHDWNERIAAECYAPNGLSRILDERDRIVEIVNNYAKISFNFGPTLLSWLEAHAPETYAAVLEADRASREAFSGHGSAIAQPYNHMILPLANRRDQETQVLWGICDFRKRFGREPEGMWLPETAVDLASLEVLAENGIRFTILAPAQAKRVRALTGRTWHETPGESVDPSRAYEVRLPSGRRIAVFFYDGPISRAVAFERLLSSGEAFAKRLAQGFSETRTGPQLVSIATDGETYGHHHRFGDMALAYTLRYLETHGLARLTNYGEFLERHPPRHVAEIHENTSWSCAHGVERWRADCGCATGAHPGWRQAWRAPLRQACDWLRDELAPAYETKARDHLKDPWAARNAYIEVVLDRSPASVDEFLAAHALRPLGAQERASALKLLGIQRHAMLMYTSCGWFFDDVSGIEAVQVLQYAGRTVQLAEEVLGRPLEGPLLERLARAPSNLPDRRSGRDVYERFVRPAAADMLRIGAHHAIASLFREDGEGRRVYSYAVEQEDYHSFEAGPARLAVGRARVSFTLTGESEALAFGVLHLGDHNVSAGVGRFRGEEAYALMAQELAEAFERGDFPGVLRLLDRHFGDAIYSLSSLLRDEQRRILSRVLDSSLAEARDEYRRLYERAQPMMRFLTSLRIPLPKAFQAAAELVLNDQIREAFEGEEPQLERARKLIEKARLEGVKLDTETLAFALRQAVERLAERFLAEPLSLPLLGRLAEAIGVVRALPFEIDLWKVQNACYVLLRRLYPQQQERVQAGDAGAADWVRRFEALGEALRVRVR